MKLNNNTGKTSLVSAVFIILCALFISASGAFCEEATVLETMIVTDSGSKTKLLDTNASISVLTEKDIKNSGQTNTAALISSIPGVVNQKASSKTYFSIRGTRGTLSGGAVIYVDGRPINTGLYGYSKIDTIPLDNIEKIEVIKSPPASKYGANAARGVILITTKRGKSAKDSVHLVNSGEYGSWDTAKVTASISGNSGKLDYSVSAYSKETDGYRETDEETKTADGSVGYKFDGGRIDLVAGINNAFTRYPAGLPESQVWIDRTAPSCDTTTGFYYRPSEADSKLYNAAVSLNYDKDNWLLNSSLAYTKDNEIYTQMKDYYNPSAAARNDDYRDDRDDQQIDVKLSGGRVFNFKESSDTLTLGMDYKKNDYDQIRSYPFNNIAMTPAMNTGKKKADIDADRSFLGINLNNDFTLDRFRFQTGFRYNNVSYDLSNQNNESVSLDYDNDFDWSVSPSYSILENANLFVTYNHSNYYMPLGHVKLDMEYDNPEAQAKDLKPEVYDEVEVGFKHQLHKAFNYSVIYYYSIIDDKVISFYNNAGSFKGYFNGGKSIHQGIEVEIDGRPLSWLGYRLGFTTIDAEWDSGKAKAYDSDGTNYNTKILDGKKVNYVPEYEYSAGVDFYPFQDKPYGSLILALDVHGFGEQYEDYNNNKNMPPAHFLDAKLSWALGIFECYVNCTNLLDREWEKVSNATGKLHSAITNPSTSGFYPQDGRYIGGGATIRF